VTNCFVAITAGGVIAGYYTLASASIPPGELAAELARHLLRYPTVPPRGSAALPSTYDFLGKVSAGFSSGMRRHERRAPTKPISRFWSTLKTTALSNSTVITASFPSRRPRGLFFCRWPPPQRCLLATREGKDLGTS
jgi:hypothetical protein